MTEKLIAAFKSVYDPEIPVDIFELGLIYRVDVSDDRDVVVDMTLTAPGCPVAGEMPGWVSDAVEGVEGVRSATVNLVVRAALGPDQDERRSQARAEPVLRPPMDAAVTARPRRPRPKVVTLTDRAAERVQAIMGRAEKPYAGLRVGVKNGGCAGQEYVLDYAEAANPLDEVVEDKGVRILIDAKAVLFLIGTEIDYETSQLAAKFVFRNPNETDACGCGESVTIVPATAD
jgi:iron-sulfur cluster assembly protein